MPKLGSKQKPIIVRAKTMEKIIEVAEICKENGWHYIGGVEPDQPENFTDLKKALKRKKKKKLKLI